MKAAASPTVDGLRWELHGSAARPFLLSEGHVSHAERLRGQLNDALRAEAALPVTLGGDTRLLVRDVEAFRRAFPRTAFTQPPEPVAVPAVEDLAWYASGPGEGVTLTSSGTLQTTHGAVPLTRDMRDLLAAMLTLELGPDTVETETKRGENRLLILPDGAAKFRERHPAARIAADRGETASRAGVAL